MLFRSRFQHYKVQHAFREVNRVADALAKLGCVMKEQFVILNAPPSDTVSCFVLSDVNGESVCRLAAPNLAILDQWLFVYLYIYFRLTKKKNPLLFCSSSISTNIIFNIYKEKSFSILIEIFFY